MYSNGCRVKVTGTPKSSGRVEVKKELIGRVVIVESAAASHTPTLYTVLIPGAMKRVCLYEDEITDFCGERVADTYLCTKKCPVDGKTMDCCCECDNKTCPSRCTVYTQTRRR